jgi:hypothetical protein
MISERKGQGVNYYDVIIAVLRGFDLHESIIHRHSSVHGPCGLRPPRWLRLILSWPGAAQLPLPREHASLPSFQTLVLVLAAVSCGRTEERSLRTTTHRTFLTRAHTHMYTVNVSRDNHNPPVMAHTRMPCRTNSLTPSRAGFPDEFGDVPSLVESRRDVPLLCSNGGIAQDRSTVGPGPREFALAPFSPLPTLSRLTIQQCPGRLSDDSYWYSQVRPLCP